MRWVAVLDSTCAWVNPGLVLVAIAVALLDLTVAAQRWAVVSSTSPVPVRTVIVTTVVERAPPVIVPCHDVAPELRDMAGHD